MLALSRLTDKVIQLNQVVRTARGADPTLHEDYNQLLTADEGDRNSVRPSGLSVCPVVRRGDQPLFVGASVESLGENALRDLLAGRGSLAFINTLMVAS